MSEAIDTASIARRFSQSSHYSDDRVPKYLRLSNAVLDAIESGDFRPGSQIPGERDLTDILPLSLGTIQKAMNDLVEQGVVFRRAGKGTFVSGADQNSVDDKVAQGDLVHFRFRAAYGGALLPIYLHVGSIEKFTSTSHGTAQPWEQFLGGEGDFVRIDRLMKVGDLFEGVCRFYLPFDRYGSLLDCSTEELSGLTLREYLNKTFNMPTLRFEHLITTEILPDGICRRLGLPRKSCGTLWQIFGRSYRNAPATYQEVYLPAGHRPIELTERLE